MDSYPFIEGGFGQLPSPKPLGEDDSASSPNGLATGSDWAGISALLVAALRYSRCTTGFLALNNTFQTSLSTQIRTGTCPKPFRLPIHDRSVVHVYWTTLTQYIWALLAKVLFQRTGHHSQGYKLHVHFPLKSSDEGLASRYLSGTGALMM